MGKYCQIFYCMYIYDLLDMDMELCEHCVNVDCMWNLIIIFARSCCHLHLYEGVSMAEEFVVGDVIELSPVWSCRGGALLDSSKTMN